jgi:small subunit ribosomal protein S17
MAETKNIGVKVSSPSKECNDKKCPFHGNLSVRGRGFTGVVISRDVHRTATVEWNRTVKISKYERYARTRTRIRVHNPSCIDAKEGDKVKIMECRPLSKTKNFVIIENLGKQFGFEQIQEGLSESKHTSEKKKEEVKKEEEAENESN